MILRTRIDGGGTPPISEAAIHDMIGRATAEAEAARASELAAALAALAAVEAESTEICDRGIDRRTGKLIRMLTYNKQIGGARL